MTLNFKAHEHTTSYYLLSSQFVKEWTIYTQYDPNNINVVPSDAPPPAPFNHDISTVNSLGVVELNTGLTKDQDFLVVSADLNAVFSENYQGNVIQKKLVRRQSGDKILEIYQIKV